MNHRAERAMMTLNAWSMAHWPEGLKRLQNEPVQAGYTGESPIANFNMLETKNHRSSRKVTVRATETRSRQEAKLPIGGASYKRSNLDLVMKVEKMVTNAFSLRVQKLLVVLFAPADTFGGHKPKDREIAKAAGFQASRACQLKMRVIDMVVRELFMPEETETKTETKEKLSA